MTIGAPKTQEEPRLDLWLDRLNRLIDQVSSWAVEEEWSIYRGQKKIHESVFGEYLAPTLRVRTPQGEVHIDPVALRVMGAAGRVDIQAWPSLHRVVLVPDGDQWEVITDSNVRLRKPWSRETFLDLVGDLLAVS